MRAFVPFDGDPRSRHKKNTFYAAGVTHYWLIDPSTKLLTVLSRGENEYQTLLSTALTEPVRVQPFTDVALDLSGLLPMLPRS